MAARPEADHVIDVIGTGLDAYEDSARELPAVEPQATRRQPVDQLALRVGRQ
jgi:hypothetical protein